MKVWMGFTRTEGSVFGWFVERVTGSKWHHGLIAFGETVPNVYFEAHAQSEEGKGFRGPKPASKLFAWAQENGHHLELVDVTKLLSEGGPERVLAWCEDEAAKHLRGYDISQLLAMWAVRRFLWRWFDVKNDPGKVVCSESQTRAMLADWVDLCFAVGRSVPDDMSPGDVKRACEILLARLAGNNDEERP